MNSVLAMILCLSTTCLQEVRPWVPDVLRNVSNYQYNPGDPFVRFPDVQNFVRIRDGCSISIECDESSPRRAASPDSIPLSASAAVLRNPLPASGIPLGSQAEFCKSVGHVFATIVNEWEYLRISIHAPLVTEGRSRYTKRIDMSAEEPWLEALARRSLGRLAARRLGAIRSVTIAGRSVRSVTAEGSNAVLYALDDWALARGVSLNRNQSDGRVSFTRGPTSHLATLGSHHLKRGATWQTMPDVVVEHQSTWWVPRQALEP